MPYKNDGSDVPEHIQKYPAVVRRQWAHVWNSIYDRTGEEGRAHSGANAVVEKHKTEEKKRKDYDRRTAI